MSQTMYAIKKVENSNIPTTTTNNNNHPSSNTEGLESKQTPSSTSTTVWQKKKRKRNRSKNKSKSDQTSSNSSQSQSEVNNMNIHLINDGDTSSIGHKSDDGKSSSHELPPSSKSEAEILKGMPLNPSHIGPRKEKSAPSYDPKSNPYSLENYRKNHELQKKVENGIAKRSKETTIKLLSKDNALLIGYATKAMHPRTAINIKSDIQKSPMSQVRLTPLFPSPQITHTATTAAVAAANGHNNNVHHIHHHFNGGHHAHLPPTIHTHTNHSGGARHVHIQRIHANPADTDPTQCPHGNLSSEELINIKIRKRNVCYVVGLPIHIATEQKLRSQEWFGQFGNIATIAINRNSKSIQANSIPAHITYDNDISALNAINFCNKFIFDDGRKLKATFGTQHYCRWFIAANKKCTNVFCGFRHSWCRPEDIITQKDINDFKAIPAGAYTSRHIENQPVGVRSASADTFSHHSHTTTSTTTTAPTLQVAAAGGTTAPPLYAYTTAATTAPIGVEEDKYLRSLTGAPLDALTAADVAAANGVLVATPTLPATVVHTQPPAPLEQGEPGQSPQKVVDNAQPNDANTTNTVSGTSNNGNTLNKPNVPSITTADPYTFYIANSAATPTGPSPISATAQPAIPNIYDSRNVLMKQIMNRNQQQQVEIDRLTQQIKILSEMELKNKQEIHRWWTELATAQQNERKAQQNEKNLQAKNDKLTNDFKSLQLKHDKLQIQYLALDQKYKLLLNSKNAETKEFEKWDTDDVVKWIMSLDNQKFKKYQDDLAKNIKTENIDGQCLESLDKGDLHRLGVTDFKDKKDLLQKIKDLVTPKEQ